MAPPNVYPLWRTGEYGEVSDHEGYVGGGVADGRNSHAGQVTQVMTQTERYNLILQVGGIWRGVDNTL